MYEIANMQMIKGRQIRLTLLLLAMVILTTVNLVMSISSPNLSSTTDPTPDTLIYTKSSELTIPESDDESSGNSLTLANLGSGRSSVSSDDEEQIDINPVANDITKTVETEWWRDDWVTSDVISGSESEESISFGIPIFIVAAADASESSKSKADFICDGINDQEEIQAAINGLPSDGGSIALSEGSYTISSTIFISVGACIDATNAQIDIRGLDDVCFEFGVEQAETDFSPASYDRISGIIGCSVAGELSNQNSVFVKFINCGRRVIVKDIILRNVATGIHLRKTNFLTQISNIHYVGAVNCIYIEGNANNSVISDCDFENATESGVYITSCGGRQPLGIVVRDSWFEGDDVGIYYGGDARRLRIEGNYFTLNTTAAIHLDGGNEAIIANNIMRNNLLVSGNSNKVLVTGNEYYWHGIVFTNTLNTHLDIIGNKFYLAKDTHGIDANSNYLKILDNVFEGNKGNNFPNVGTGIKKLGYNGTVSGNIFHNLDEGILSTGARTIIQNNVFSDCTIAIGSFGPDSSILYNSFNDCSNTISNPGQGHVLLSNSGYLTENSGIATLPAKSSHVVVDHGCAIPPMVVNITLAERLANKISYWWVDSIDDTTFTFHVDTAPGENNLDFYWTATVK